MLVLFALLVVANLKVVLVLVLVVANLHVVLLKNWGNWHNFWLTLMFLGEIEFTGAVCVHGDDGANEFGGSRGGGVGGDGGGGGGHLT